MKLLHKYIRELIAESPEEYFEMMGLDPLTDEVQTANDAIESRHPAHAFPNSEHVEGSIGHILELISLKKKYGRSRSEHETQAILDKWRGRMGAGSGKGMAAWTLALAGGGLITADMVFLGGSFTAMGLSGAGLNVIHEVMAGNAVDDDLKEYIRWDPEILEWMDDKTEDKLEDEWIDLLFDHISKNPKDNLVTFISINDYANKRLGRPLTGEKIQIKTNELRQYIRSLLTEVLETTVQIQPNSQIFCDMDGVLVDFETAVVQLLNDTLDGAGLPGGVKRTKGHFARFKEVQDELGKDWRAETGSDLNIPIIRKFMFGIVGANPGHVFASMPAYPDGLTSLWPFLNSTGHTVNLLTAPISARKGALMTAGEGKIIWAEHNLSPSPSDIIVTPARQKPEYANINGIPNILIDDKASTIDSWNAAGGIGILHIPENSTRTITILKEILK